MNLPAFPSSRIHRPELKVVFIWCPTDLVLVIMSPGEHWLWNIQSMRYFDQCTIPLSHTASTSNKHDAYSQLCTVDTHEKIDG